MWAYPVSRPSLKKGRELKCVFFRPQKETPFGMWRRPHSVSPNRDGEDVIVDGFFTCGESAA